MDSPHKGPVARKIFPFDDVFMYALIMILTVTCTRMVTLVVISVVAFVMSIRKMNLKQELFELYVIPTNKLKESLIIRTLHLGCQADGPLASLVTTNRISNVYGFWVVIMLLIYSVLHCLYSDGNEITTATATQCYCYYFFPTNKRKFYDKQQQINEP